MMKEAAGVRPVRSAFELVRAVSVRLVDGGAEVKRWDETIRREHYLGLQTLVGQTLRYVAEIDGQWVALLGFTGGARKVSARDSFIGWSADQQRTRLDYVAQNARFLIRAGYHVPNLGSRILGLVLRRLSADWQAVHGHPVLLCETFVDPAHFDGGVYRAAGFTHIGETSGYARAGQTWIEHKHPKLVFVRPLRRQAVDLLCQPFLSAQIAQQTAAIDPNVLPLDGPKGLVTFMHKVHDPRMPRGIRHSIPSVLAVAALAVICGQHGYHEMGQWAKALAPDQLRRLGCFHSPSSGRYVAPSSETIRRVLMTIDPDELDRAICDFLRSAVPPRPGAGLAFDGKTLRGSASQSEGQRHLLSAVQHGLGILRGQVEVDGKANEIPAAHRLFDQLSVAGTVVTADAMHTQERTAKAIVERGGEYLLIAKDNQPSLRQSLAALDWRLSPPC